MVALGIIIAAQFWTCDVSNKHLQEDFHADEIHASSTPATLW